MLMHVENLKRIHDREHSELEESRKLLAANNLSVEDHRRPGGLEASGSLSPSLGRPNSRGRSVSVIHPGQGSPTNTLGAALVSMIFQTMVHLGRSGVKLEFIRKFVRFYSKICDSKEQKTFEKFNENLFEFNSFNSTSTKG